MYLIKKASELFSAESENTLININSMNQNMINEVFLEQQGENTDFRRFILQKKSKGLNIKEQEQIKKFYTPMPPSVG